MLLSIPDEAKGDSSMFYLHVVDCYLEGLYVAQYSTIRKSIFVSLPSIKDYASSGRSNAQT